MKSSHFVLECAYTCAETIQLQLMFGQFTSLVNLLVYVQLDL